MRTCKLCGNYITGLSPICPSCSQTIGKKKEDVPRPPFSFGQSPHSIFCNICHDVVLTEDEYHLACNSLDDEWTCPICGKVSFYNQESEEAYFKASKAEYDSEGER